jgi:hypothetical protein
VTRDRFAKIMNSPYFQMDEPETVYGGKFINFLERKLFYFFKPKKKK